MRRGLVQQFAFYSCPASPRNTSPAVSGDQGVEQAGVIPESRHVTHRFATDADEVADEHASQQTFAPALEWRDVVNVRRM